MAEYSANAVQTVQPGAFAIFTATVAPCDRGLIGHSDETPIFSLDGWRPNNSGCCCNRNKPTLYDVKVNMNVALAEGATVAPISVTLAVDGASYPLSEMDSTPAAVGEFNHIGNDLALPILRNCCQAVAVQNTSTQSIDIKNLTIKFSRPDLNSNNNCYY